MGRLGGRNGFRATVIPSRSAPSRYSSSASAIAWAAVRLFDDVDDWRIALGSVTDMKPDTGGRGGGAAAAGRGTTAPVPPALLVLPWTCLDGNRVIGELVPVGVLQDVTSFPPEDNDIAASTYENG